jgi:serine/threonine-protein kinase 24/25/MST4
MEERAVPHIQNSMKKHCESWFDSMTNLGLINSRRNTIAQREEPDEWVFDTIKAGTTAAKKNTTKRRKLSVIAANGQNSQTGVEESLRRLDMKDSPLQMSSPPSSTVKRSTVRRQPSTTQAPPPTAKLAIQKRPLQPDMNFGNSGSTVRLFRRVSDNSVSGVVGSGDTSIGARDENRPPMAETVTKEALLGRRVYNKVLDSTFQEVHAQTSNQAQREALSRLADAWSALDAIDPEGEYQLLKLVIEKVQHDPKLCALIPVSCDGTPQTTPQKQKLVMAQNNPHLKSHRRRQSTQVAEDAWKEKITNLPGQAIPGMEHTKQLADVIYGRWSGGLANRWPAVQ